MAKVNLQALNLQADKAIGAVIEQLAESGPQMRGWSRKAMENLDAESELRARVGTAALEWEIKQLTSGGPPSPDSVVVRAVQDSLLSLLVIIGQREVYAEMQRQGML